MFDYYIKKFKKGKKNFDFIYFYLQYLCHKSIPQLHLFTKLIFLKKENYKNVYTFEGYYNYEEYKFVKETNWK